MVLGRVVHFGVDAVLFSTLLAGIKRTSGYTPDVERLGMTEGSTAKSIAEKYMGLGEFVFDSSIAAARASQYFAKGQAEDSRAKASLFETFGQSASNLASSSSTTTEPARGAGTGGWWK